MTNEESATNTLRKKLEGSGLPSDPKQIVGRIFQYQYSCAIPLSGTDQKDTIIETIIGTVLGIQLPHWPESPKTGGFRLLVQIPPIHLFEQEDGGLVLVHILGFIFTSGGRWKVATHSADEGPEISGHLRLL